MTVEKLGSKEISFRTLYLCHTIRFMLQFFKNDSYHYVVPVPVLAGTDPVGGPGPLWPKKKN